MTSLFVPLHVTPNAKILAASIVLALVWLLAGVGERVNLQRAGS